MHDGMATSIRNLESRIQNRIIDDQLDFSKVILPTSWMMNSEFLIEKGMSCTKISSQDSIQTEDIASPIGYLKTSRIGPILRCII